MKSTSEMFLRSTGKIGKKGQFYSGLFPHRESYPSYPGPGNWVLMFWLDKKCLKPSLIIN